MKKEIISSFLALTIALSATPVFATYTNEESSSSSVVNSITLSVGDNNKLSWTIDGYSKNGFKVVWSKNSGPTYPTRDGDQYHYYSDPAYKYDYVNAFNGEGTYYVRVCEYLGGACGVYSNEVTVNLTSESKENIIKEIKTTVNKLISTKVDLKNITDPSQLPSGYEKISKIEDIKYFEKIIKVGDTDLYGIKIAVTIPKGKEWIKSLSDIKYFKNIEKVGDALYGVRISTEKKTQIQKKIDDVNKQIIKLQEQIAKLTAELNTITE